MDQTVTRLLGENLSKLLWFIRVLLILFLLVAQTEKVSAEQVTAFSPGERLEYVLKWSGIAAGDSVMEVVEGEPVDGIPLFRVISTAESRSLVDVFYKVRNSYETHIHPFDGLTRKYVFNMNEGGKHKSRVLLFDQERRIVTRILREKGQTQSKIYEIARASQDNLSSLYAVRNQDLEVGDSVVFSVFEGKKNWELVVDVLAAEEIKVKAGTFKTLKIHPKLKFEGIFRRKGELYVWVTDDKWHIPVLMKSQVRIGSIDAELVRYTLGEENPAVPSLVHSGETE
jgi:hypothetical protein